MLTSTALDPAATPGGVGAPTGTIKGTIEDSSWCLFAWACEMHQNAPGMLAATPQAIPQCIPALLSS